MDFIKNINEVGSLDFKITEEKLLEVTEHYGIAAKKVDNVENAGFFVNGESIEAEELFHLLFNKAKHGKSKLFSKEFDNK